MDDLPTVGEENRGYENGSGKGCPCAKEQQATLPREVRLSIVPCRNRHQHDIERSHGNQGVLREAPGNGVDGDFTRRAKIPQHNIVGEKADPYRDGQNEEPDAGGVGFANCEAVDMFHGHVQWFEHTIAQQEFHAAARYGQCEVDCCQR